MAIGLRDRSRMVAGTVLRSRAVPSPVRDRLLEWRWGRSARRALGVPRRPETFNEKTRFKMATDRRPLLTTLSDKVAARDYVEGVLGPGYLPDLFLATDDPRELRPERLPREVAVKVSHASGGSVLVSDCAPRGNALRMPHVGWMRFLVRPDGVDWDLVRALCTDWLSRPYKPETEWASRGIRPRVLAEELLHENGAIARDIKLFTFHGRVRMISVDLDRFTGHVRALYTPDWERLPFELNFPAGPELERPPGLGEMIAIAERLAGDLDFLRVDLYAPGGRIVVGELTSYHGAGVEEFRPSQWDRWLGSWWTLPRRYR